MSDFQGEAGFEDLALSVREISVPDPVVLFNIANDIVALGSRDAAVVFYREAIRRGVEDAYLNLGTLYDDAGEH